MTLTKYSANGNDFILFIAQNRADRSEMASKLCHRQNGIGADGMVVLLPHEKYDFEWEFYNADGSLADMCGNASRAVAHFATEKGISPEGRAEFLTGAGVIKAIVNGLYVVSDMTTPNIIDKKIVEDGEEWWFINTGVPHLVAIRDELEPFDIKQMRRLRDKYNCNVNICKPMQDMLYVRTYERGVEDETLACGTGMVACFVRCHEEGMLNDSVKTIPTSQDELYISIEEGIYRFGGKVTKTFVAETVD